MKERRRYTLDNAEDFFAATTPSKRLLPEIYGKELPDSAFITPFYQVMMPQYGADLPSAEASSIPTACSVFLDEWIKRGFYETPERITELFRR